MDLHGMFYGNNNDYFDFCIFFLGYLGSSESLGELVA